MTFSERSAVAGNTVIPSAQNISLPAVKKVLSNKQHKHSGKPGGELLTRDERYEKANQEEIRLSDVRWKHLSLDDLYALLNRMNGDKTTLQDASSREFTGNGGRRTSAAVAAQEPVIRPSCADVLNVTLCGGGEIHISATDIPAKVAGLW